MTQTKMFTNIFFLGLICISSGLRVHIEKADHPFDEDSKKENPFHKDSSVELDEDLDDTCWQKMHQFTSLFYDRNDDSDSRTENKPTIRYFLNGEPRSGTEWMSSLVDMALISACKSQACKIRKGHKQEALDQTNSSTEWHYQSKHGIPGIGHKGQVDMGRAPIKFSNSPEQLEQAIRKMLSTTSSRWIMISRDPRDVLRSTCHLVNSAHWQHCDANKYAKGNFHNNVDWINLRYRAFKEIARQTNGERALIIFYENLKTDFVGEFSKVLHFMGLNPADVDFKTLNPEKIVGCGTQKQGLACSFHKEISNATANAIRTYMSETMLPEQFSVFSPCA